ncbi:MAG: [FeFe] hydrogenase H-cluster radical SAM maturase HydE [Candidatus Adiutrix sp.]|jgi:biotin synthase|nr:[FeFe] hydrogenase H-cluster radical SAM maturase HydE [Candidatus Adiutrix sp.]
MTVNTLRLLIDRLERERQLEKSEFITLLEAYQNPELAASLAQRAGAVRDAAYGRAVFLRGLIEFTNFCKNDCLYCGLRHSNREVERYRLGPEEILERCRLGRALGFRTFVLQGGEDPYYTDERLVEIIVALKAAFPDCAVTLSVGEKSRESYERYFRAGADRFLLRHETADPEHYGKLHPPEMSLTNRQRCLFELKDIGFQVGAGFMVGSPGQSFASLADDLLFLQKLSPQMAGVGPFIPHPRTPLGAYPAGSTELTVFILGLVRLMLPRVLLPATTALGTLDPQGREKALNFGANVMMPNLSPLEVRSKYDIYTGKIHLDEEAAEGLDRLKKHLAQLGYETPESRGDFKAFC